MPIYMNYPGIKGTGKGKHAGWIELDSCSIGVSRGISSPTGSSSDREGSSPPEIMITKHQDSTSTQLFNESLRGTGQTVTIDFVKNDDTPYLSLELKDTMISSFNITGHGGSGEMSPRETLTLNFAKITYSAKPTATTTGTPDTVGWDLLTSKYDNP